MGPSDLDLIARVLASDDRHAFATLVRRHQAAVRGLLRRLTCGQGALADDLAQDTFLRAYRSLGTYRGGARFSTWLHSIAYHLFLNDRRRRRPEATQAPEPAEPSQAGRSLLRHDLARAMEALRPEERLALALAFGQDYSHQEVAEILGCPLGTVKTHIARGKDKLKARLGAWETRGPEDRP